MGNVLGMAYICWVRGIATQKPDTPLIKPRSGNVNDMLHIGLIGQSHYVFLICVTDSQQTEIQIGLPTIEHSHNMVHSVSMEEPEHDFEQITNIYKPRLRQDNIVLVDIEQHEYVRK